MEMEMEFLRKLPTPAELKEEYPVNEHSEIPYVADLEKEMLEKINKLGIGPGGLGGTTTALAVNINTYPTHIAGLPVAVNICCHSVPPL